jgi:hypothetical protein
VIANDSNLGWNEAVSTLVIRNEPLGPAREGAGTKFASVGNRARPLSGRASEQTTLVVAATCASPSSANEGGRQGSQRAMRERTSPNSNSPETDVPGVLLAQIDIGDL